MSPTPIATSLVIEVGAMPLEKNKMLEVFLGLEPPRFFKAVGEDANEFLMTCMERLCTLWLIECRRVDFTT